MVVLVSGSPLSVVPAWADNDIHFHNVTFHRCYHVHSCFVTIPGVPAIFGDVLLVRLAGVDTPEILGKCEREKKLATEARNFVNTLLLNARDIELHEIERGENFNLIAKILANGQNVSDLLVEKQWAVRQADGKGKTDWCKK